MRCQCWGLLHVCGPHEDAASGLRTRSEAIEQQHTIVPPDVPGLQHSSGPVRQGSHGNRRHQRLF